MKIQSTENTKLTKEVVYIYEGLVKQKAKIEEYKILHFLIICIEQE